MDFYKTTIAIFVLLLIIIIAIFSYFILFKTTETSIQHDPCPAKLIKTNINGKNLCVINENIDDAVVDLEVSKRTIYVTNNNLFKLKDKNDDTKFANIIITENYSNFISKYKSDIIINLDFTKVKSDNNISFYLNNDSVLSYPMLYTPSVTSGNIATSSTNSNINNKNELYFITDTINTNKFNCINNNTNYYVNFPNTNIDLSTASGFSCSFWVFSTSNDNNYRRIFSLSIGGEDKWSNSFHISVLNNNITFVFYYSNDNSNKSTFYQMEKTISLNTWYHCVFTINTNADNTTGNINIYINGIKVNDNIILRSYKIVSNNIIDNSLNIFNNLSNYPNIYWKKKYVYNHIGTFYNNTDISCFFKGKLAHFLFLKKAIAITDVTTLYNIKSTDLVNYKYPTYDSSNNTIKFLKNNNYNDINVLQLNTDNTNPTELTMFFCIIIPSLINNNQLLSSYKNFDSSTQNIDYTNLNNLKWISKDISININSSGNICVDINNNGIEKKLSTTATLSASSTEIYYICIRLSIDKNKCQIDFCKNNDKNVTSEDITITDQFTSLGSFNNVFELGGYSGFFGTETNRRFFNGSMNHFSYFNNYLNDEAVKNLIIFLYTDKTYLTDTKKNTYGVHSFNNGFDPYVADWTTNFNTTKLECAWHKWAVQNDIEWSGISNVNSYC